MVGLAAGAAQATTSTASFTVSIVVVESCTVTLDAKGPRAACQPPQRGAQQTIPARDPLVRISQNPTTGGVVRTVEF